MKILTLLSSLCLCTSCGVPFVGAITSPYGSASYSSKGGVAVSADAGTIAERFLRVESQ